MIRNTLASDKQALFDIIQESGEFDAASQAHVEHTLEEYLSGGNEAIWLTALAPDSGEPVGVAYCNPEPVTTDTWNLLMLWTRRNRQGRGIGAALVLELELLLRQRAARLLLVETSALPTFDTARVFYERCGFTREAIIRHFYAHDDHKVVYVKSLA